MWLINLLEDFSPLMCHLWNFVRSHIGKISQVIPTAIKITSTWRNKLEATISFISWIFLLHISTGLQYIIVVREWETRNGKIRTVSGLCEFKSSSSSPVGLPQTWPNFCPNNMGCTCMSEIFLRKPLKHQSNQTMFLVFQGESCTLYELPNLYCFINHSLYSLSSLIARILA